MGESLRYDHPILLVETYVGPQRFAGTCYRVANWIEIGLCGLDAARQGKRASHLPRFRKATNNHRQVAIDLISRLLLNGS